MRRPFTLAFALLAAAPVCARAEAGQTGAVTLSRPLGARAAAMADAFCGARGGLDSLTYNPAGLTGLDHKELRTDLTRCIADDNFSFLGYGQPFKRAALAAGLAYYDAGTITLNPSNGARETRRVEQDWLGILGGGVDLAGGLSVGALAKYYRLTLAQEATASGLALDAGTLWRSPLQGLSFGAALQNAGSAVKFEQEADPLPLTLRAGAAYQLNLELSHDQSAVNFDKFLLTADAIHQRDERTAAAVGAEMSMILGAQSHGALRFGYIFNRDIDSFSFGLGMREGRYLFDYALGVKKAIGNAHHISLGIRL